MKRDFTIILVVVSVLAFLWSKLTGVIVEPPFSVIASFMGGMFIGWAGAQIFLLRNGDAVYALFKKYIVRDSE